MATATITRVGDEIKLGPAPQVFALRFTTGKSVTSKFPGGRVMFTAVDERKIFLNDEDANEFEHAMLEQNIQPADFMQVSRVSHGHGGGFSIRVTRVPDADDAPAWVQPSRDEALLAKSVELARAQGPAAFTAQRPAAAPTETASRSSQKKDGSDPAVSELQNAVQQFNTTPVTAKFMAAYAAAIDTLCEARVYAQRKGIALEIRCEDVRCLAATLIIDAKGGR